MEAVSSSSPARSFLSGQPRELPTPRVVGREERLLAVQGRRVRARGVIRALDLAGAEVELDTPQQGRVQVGVEGTGIGGRSRLLQEDHRIPL
jgi:hypothetical protein